MEEEPYSYEDEHSIESEQDEDISRLLQDLVHKPNKKSHYPYNIEFAKEQYANCVKSLVAQMGHHYQDFIDQKVSKNVEKTCFEDDEVGEFTNYLVEVGAYNQIQNTFRKKISLLLDQKFRPKFSSLDKKECQDSIAEIFLYLVEEMNEAINSGFEGEVLPNRRENRKIDFLYFADEYYELGKVEAANYNYKQIIADQPNDSNSWLKYAIFLKKINDLERSFECSLEAISFDNRNYISLLFYGVLLAENENYHEAEIFLKAANHLYPQMLESWMILHLFYFLKDSTLEMNITLKIAEKCLEDENRNEIEINCMKKEPFSWSTYQHCSEDQIYIIIAIFLLKLNLYKFAEMALNRDFEINGKSIPWIYFSAVLKFLQGNYSDALTQLKEAEIEHGQDFSIMSLMGHCFFKQGCFEEAIECYEFCTSIFDRPDNIHMVKLRLGNIYLETQDYKKAKKTFFQICKNYPTSSSWLGLGASYYHLGEFDEAEMALMEANFIDSRNPDVWAYLTLLSISLKRHHEFSQCYRQTILNGLDNVQLSKLIIEAIDINDFQKPENIHFKEQFNEYNF